MPKLLRFKDVFKEGHPLAKPLSFNDMHETEYRPGEDELTNYRAYRRKRAYGVGTGEGGYVGESTEQEVDESLNTAQRLARRRLMKKLAPKIKIGRERAKRRMPDMKRFKRRADKEARTLILKKITKGVPKGELSFARRQEIEKRLAKPEVKKRIDRLSKRLIKDVRKKEMERRRAK
mgnify:CR=1 FL=1|jgi:hypothetical protein